MRTCKGEAVQVCTESVQMWKDSAQKGAQDDDKAATRVAVERAVCVHSAAKMLRSWERQGVDRRHKRKGEKRCAEESRESAVV